MIKLRRGIIDLRSDPHPGTRRIIPIRPVLRAWLHWLKQRSLPFYPRRHSLKSRAIRALALAQGTDPLPAGKPPVRNDSCGMARRSYISYRLALRGASYAEVSDEVGNREKHLQVYFTAAATCDDAERYFDLTPARIEHAEPLGGDPIPVDRSDLEDELMAYFAELATAIGLPRSHGTIYGLFFASPQPLSFTDTVDRLDLSVGAVSLGLQALHKLGALHPAAGPVGRRDHFVADIELPRLLSDVLRQRVQTPFDDASVRVAALRSRHRHALTASAVLRERLKVLESWQRQASAFLHHELKLRDRRPGTSLR